MLSDQAYIALIILLGVALLLSMFKVAVRLMHTIKEVDSQSPSACTTPRFTRRTPPAFHLASLAEKQNNCQMLEVVCQEKSAVVRRKSWDEAIEFQAPRSLEMDKGNQKTLWIPQILITEHL